MSQTLKHVQEHLDESAPTDVTETFSAWLALVERLQARVQERFSLERDPSSEVLEDVGSDDGPRGRVRTYAGPEIDWMVHSHMENAAAGFCNVHLTIWLGPQVKVPHFGMALGCFPHGWMYLDSVPRSYLVTDTDSYDRYYEPVNARWEQVRNDNDWLEPFISRSGFVRAGLSPTAFCYMAPADERMTDLVSELATEHLERWLGWVDEAPRVPADEQAALAAADEAIRRNIAERDPANVMGDRYFGADTTQRLVRALWGGDRMLPRAHEQGA
ncbi:red chlorophyll catabolite reductase (RCC reductase) [Mumia flava]|uniref:Red chlorophyll catabolite reductase (RCC reductase) n=1 Tax=Mumia flava TaxID=1348852 RepID=A0A0B2BL00_9ACTN|nr:oxidoreductase [Mumia flava]PJJ56368.1 red chlorophyll catabolite reductase (RCC reductase) [Mumia flava]